MFGGGIPWGVVGSLQWCGLWRGGDGDGRVGSRGTGWGRDIMSDGDYDVSLGIVEDFEAVVRQLLLCWPYVVFEWVI